jgi:AbiV family abortive infection protein
MGACRSHAADLLSAATKLIQKPATPNLAYHLALLALEEIGKARLIGSRAAIGAARDSSWIDKWLSNHTRKIWWALWTPFGKIDPAAFREAKALAERLHAQRLVGLYVDPSADAPFPRNAVSLDEAQSLIELGRSLLRTIDISDDVQPEVQQPALLDWFLRTLDDPESTRVLFSRPFVAKYEELNGDTLRWAEWSKREFERLAAEADDVMRRELARQPGSQSSERPKWRIRTRAYTALHSLRPRVLNYWNDRIDLVKLISTGKKNEFILELSLTDAVILPDVCARGLGLTKMILAFLSIGSTGYFWFDKPAFRGRVFEEIKDFNEPDFKIQIEPQITLLENGRAIALTEQHLQHAVECMSTFMPMDEKAAEPIFWPYFHGLALVAKSDVHISTEAQAHSAFVSSLQAALRQFGAWDGQKGSFLASLNREFEPIIPEAEDRVIVFAGLGAHFAGANPTLEDVITTKRLVDLFLIRTARDRWQQSLLDWKAQRARDSKIGAT